MSSITSSTWRIGITASAAKGTEKNLVEGNVYHRKGEGMKLASGRKLRVALNTHLKGDRERFAAAVADLMDIGVTTAYEYVQAADAFDSFSEAVKATGTDLAPIGVRTWAKLDRFTGSDEALADGMAVVKAEAKRAKVEGTNAFTNAGLADTLLALRGDKVPSPVSDRRVGKITDAWSAKVDGAFVAFEKVVGKEGPRAAFFAAVRFGIGMGAQDGPAADLALTAIHSAILLAERDAEKKAAMDAAYQAAQAGAPKVEAPTPTVKRVAAKPRTPGNTGPITPKAPAPKRTRKAAAAK